MRGNALAIFNVLVLLLLLFSAPAWGEDSPFSVTVIKVNKSYYANGEAYYRARCNVKNKTDQSGSFSVRLAGLDKQGVAVHHIELPGKITANGKKVLRSKGKMNGPVYKSIKDWILAGAAFD